MGGVLIRPIILTVCIYLFLKFIVPVLPHSAPLPSSLIFLYLMLVMSGSVLFATLSGESKDAFFQPILRFLTGESGGALSSARYLVLALFPLLVGWQAYGSTASSDAPPGENRTIHPAPPGEYTGLSNPVPKTPENIMYGKGLYASRCAPCHGNFDGKGFAAAGFTPPPANFTDTTTIAMLEESYLF